MEPLINYRHPSYDLKKIELNGIIKYKLLDLRSITNINSFESLPLFNKKKYSKKFHKNT